MPKIVDVKLKLQIPGFVGFEGTWRADDAEIKASWELYIELVTRSPLGDISSRDGLIREGLTSMHSLFATTRSILRTHGPGVAKIKKGDDNISFGYFAVSMLNFVLRPMLSEWHPSLQQWESEKNPNVSAIEHEKAWCKYADYHDRLGEVRGYLLEYARLFAEVSGVPDLIFE